MTSFAGQPVSSYGYGAVPTLFLVLSICTVGLRVYVRTRVLRVFLVEDWFCILTTVLFIAQTALLYKFDELLQSSTPGLDTFTSIINIVIADVVIYICSSITLKLSLAFFFLRFVLEKWQRILIYSILAIFVADNISSVFLVLFWCSNPTTYAEKTLSGQCTGTSNALNAANILQGVLNALTDWMLATIPAIVVITTTMLSRREKVIIASIFAFAVAGSVAAILRTVYWPTLTTGSLHGFRTGMTWSTVEIGAGLVASSAATLRRLMQSSSRGQDQSIKQSYRSEQTDRSGNSEKSTVTTCPSCSRSVDGPSLCKPISSSATEENVPKTWWDVEALLPDSDSIIRKSRQPGCLLPDIEE